MLIGFLYFGAIFVVVGLLVLDMVSTNRKRIRALKSQFGNAPRDCNINFESIDAFHRVTHSKSSPTIDDTTWNDLEMDRIFERLDTCCSSIGEEYLYAVLRRPEVEPDQLLAREKLIQYLDENEDTRFAIQIALLNIGKEPNNGLAQLLSGDAPVRRIRPEALIWLLAALPILSALLLFISIKLGVAFILVFSIINCIIYIRNKLGLEADFITLRYFTSMINGCNALCKKKFAGWSAFVAPLQMHLRPFQKVSGIMTSTYVTKQASFELQALTGFFQMIFLTEIRNYNRIMRSVASNRESLRNLFIELGEIETAISVLSYRKSFPNTCIPTFTDRNQIVFQGLVHPLMPQAVPNSGKLDRGALITGSNATGKSTFIKALAVNGILATTIYTCNATYFETRPLLVITSMALRDNMLSGESYFVVEIKSIQRLLKAIEQTDCVCYIDEILRGTNTPERIAASTAILKYIARKQCLCVVASHDIELSELLRDHYNLYHFSETITGDTIRFDYQLKAGPSTTHNAIELLRIMGIPSDIIVDAESSFNR
ncbi:MAG: hypothetical protein PHW41_01375 [Eubacteriales bacterium]|nr:hypothetical protein [Eubacteriales bacterium]